jgi:ferrous iron transport protein A
MKSVATLNIGERHKITLIPSLSANFYLLEMGFTPGQEIEVLSKSPFNGPISVALRGAVIALRKSEANQILC